MYFIVKTNASALPDLIKGVKVLSLKVATNKNDIEIGTIDLLLPTASQSGASITLFERMMFFKTKEYTVMMVIAAEPAQRTKLNKLFQGIADSIKVE